MSLQWYQRLGEKKISEMRSRDTVKEREKNASPKSAMHNTRHVNELRPFFWSFFVGFIIFGKNGGYGGIVGGVVSDVDVTLYKEHRNLVEAV